MSTNELSQLLCFAHRGEASAFFKAYDFKASDLHADFWICDQGLGLLLTGEGLGKAFSKLGLILGAYHQQAELEIYNLGVAGALREDLEIASVHQVRTVYGEEEFHSFELDGTLDLITAKKRVLNSEQGNFLSAFAPLVDRELWALCTVAKEAKRSIRALKIISDRPGAEEICTITKENAQEWSEKLLAAFRQLTKKEASNESKSNSNMNDPLGILENSAWHFTTTQKRQYENYLQKWQLRDFSILELQNLAANIDHHLKPKLRTQMLLSLMQERFSPLETRLRKKIESFLQPHQNQNLQIRFDQSLESQSLDMHLKVHDQKQFEEVQASLQALPLKKFWSALQNDLGEDDV